MATALTLWFRVRSEVRGSRRGRAFEVFDRSGTPIASAWAEPWAREIAVGGETVLRRRRLFPLTGRVDIVDAATGAALGRTGRGGVVRDADDRELGRFRDARTARDFLGEGLFDLFGAILTGGDGSSSTPSGATGYVWRVAGRPRGRLYRAPWPFAGAEASMVAHERRSWLARLVPERLARLLRRVGHDPTWVLELEGVGAAEQRLVLAAAVFAIELSHW